MHLLVAVLAQPGMLEMEYVKILSMVIGPHGVLAARQLAVPQARRLALAPIPRLKMAELIVVPWMEVILLNPAARQPVLPAV